MNNSNLKSIAKAQEALAMDGIILSKFTLRRWAKDGTLPALHSGKKILLHYPTILKILTNQEER